MGVAIHVDNVTKAYGKNIVIQGLSADRPWMTMFLPYAFVTLSTCIATPIAFSPFAERGCYT